MLRTRICNEQKSYRSAETLAIIARGATQWMQRLISISPVKENILYTADRDSVLLFKAISVDCQ